MSTGSLESPRDSHSLHVYQSLIEKREQQGGIIHGAHGTSKSLAEQILLAGFHDYRCVEGYYGVWFWDDTVAQNAELAAVRKAHELGESEYAIITSELYNPTPDKRGRKQWLVPASDVHILSVEFYPLNQQ